MASKFLTLLSLLVLAASCLAGVTTYSYTPYATYQHYPAASVTTYSSPAAQQYVYQQAAPAYYQQSPVYTRSYVSSAPVVAAAPTARTVAAAPAVYHNSPFVTKAYVASAPIVKTVTAAAPATYVAGAAPVVTKTVVAGAAPAAIVKQVEIESEPQYDFEYGVHDSLTGDIKSQRESRSGGNVAGSYSVVDADGYKRTVTYTADDLNGFNAVVQREPIVARAAVVAAPAATLVQPVQQVVAAQAVVPVHQQHIQYLPQQQHQIAVAQPAEQQPEQPSVEPVPVEYPEQQSEFVQQQQQHQQQHIQSQYPQGQDFPPYQQQHAEGDDSDVVDLRATNNAAPSKVNSPAPAAKA
ncbi:cuticle protein 19.8 [Eurosta solidaginis]|uniref:cuticle protein 19.8 n=1 Tax=Eurosta solidaginis TaxID=178769 RepID=UPI003530F00E